MEQILINITEKTIDEVTTTSIVVNATISEDEKFVKVASSNLTEKELAFKTAIETAVENYRKG